MSQHPFSPESREAISARLRLTRDALEMTQSEWCRRTGIATNTWNNYEKGLNRISLDEAFKIARTIGATLDWIYRGDESGLPKRITDGLERLREKERSQERLRA